MAVEPKTIYLEADEEVTSVIDKLRKTEFKEVILVVPKDASLVQSVVNLKLIKRQAENLGKTISIISGDKVGRNLAEKVGLATAAKVGQEPKKAEAEEEKPVQKDNSPIENTSEVVFKKKDAETDIPEDELVVSEDEDTEAEANWHEKKTEEKKPKNLMPKFPKKKLLLIGLPIVFVVLLLGFIFLPRAKATIYVAAEEKPVNIDFSGEKNAKVDAEKELIPSQTIESIKDSSKKYSATGKKNTGTKASGSVKIINSSAVNTLEWSAGTRLYPSGNQGLIFKTTSAVSITPIQTSQTVTVEADLPGDQYNGFNNVAFLSVTLGSQPAVYTATSVGSTTGGTNKEVTFVTQSDINNAKAELSKEALGEATTDFNNKVENLKVVDESKKEEVISASANPTVNGEVAEFTMAVKVSIKALAYNMNDINSLIKASVEKEYGYSKQIIDNGSEDATVEINSSDLASGKFAGSIKTEAYIASKLKESEIKDELKGLNSAKANNYLTGLEGVEEAKIQFWPSFIKIMSRLKNNIYLDIQVAEKAD